MAPCCSVPVRVGDGSSVGLRSVVAPYTQVPDGEDLGPVTSTYDTEAFGKHHARVNRRSISRAKYCDASTCWRSNYIPCKPVRRDSSSHRSCTGFLCSSREKTTSTSLQTGMSLLIGCAILLVSHSLSAFVLLEPCYRHSSTCLQPSSQRNSLSESLNPVPGIRILVGKSFATGWLPLCLLERRFKLAPISWVATTKT